MWRDSTHPSSEKKMVRPLHAAAIGLACLLAACGESKTSTPTSPETAGDASAKAPRVAPRSERKTGEGITLGVIPKSTGGEFWETVEKGARAAAEKAGVELLWEGTVTETEIAEQNKIIENMINMGVDGIALAPLNEKAQVKFAQSAVDAGIPVVVFDSPMEWNGHSSFVATDNHVGGGTASKVMFERLNKGKRVMVMRYIQGAGSTEARAAGFLENARRMGIEIVADPYPDTGTIEGSKNAAANTLEGFVENGVLELDGIFACNLYSTLGVDAALEDLRKSGVAVKLVFVGFDTSKKLIEAVQVGRIQALIAQDPFRMGNMTVKTLAQVVAGEKVKPRIDTGVSVVTRESLKDDPKVRRLVGLEGQGEKDAGDAAAGKKKARKNE